MAYSINIHGNNYSYLLHGNKNSLKEGEIGDARKWDGRQEWAGVLAIPPSVGAMSTSQRTVMLSGWGVKAGMVCQWAAGKTVIHLLLLATYLSALEMRFFIIRRYTNWSYPTLGKKKDRKNGTAWVAWKKYRRWERKDIEGTGQRGWELKAHSIGNFSLAN